MGVSELTCTLQELILQIPIVVSEMCYIFRSSACADYLTNLIFFKSSILKTHSHI